MSRGRVITFLSPKGGTGKSMIVLHLAETLRRIGARVLIIDADSATAGITAYLYPGIRSSGLDYCERNCLFTIYREWIRNGQPSVLPHSLLIEPRPVPFDIGSGGPSPAARVGASGEISSILPTWHLWRAGCESELGDERDFATFLGAQLQQLLANANYRFDYILIDTRGGSDSGAIAACACADRIVFVTEPNRISASQVQSLIRRLGLAIPKLRTHYCQRDQSSAAETDSRPDPILYPSEDHGSSPTTAELPQSPPPATTQRRLPVPVTIVVNKSMHPRADEKLVTELLQNVAGADSEVLDLSTDPGAGFSLIPFDQSAAEAYRQARHVDALYPASEFSLAIYNLADALLEPHANWNNSNFPNLDSQASDRFQAAHMRVRTGSTRQKRLRFVFYYYEIFVFVFLLVGIVALSLMPMEPGRGWELLLFPIAPLALFTVSAVSILKLTYVYWQTYTVTSRKNPKPFRPRLWIPVLSTALAALLIWLAVWGLGPTPTEILRHDRDDQILMMYEMDALLSDAGRDWARAARGFGCASAAIKNLGEDLKLRDTQLAKCGENPNCPSPEDPGGAAEVIRKLEAREKADSDTIAKLEKDALNHLFAFQLDVQDYQLVYTELSKANNSERFLVDWGVFAFRVGHYSWAKRFLESVWRDPETRAWRMSNGAFDTSALLLAACYLRTDDQESAKAILKEWAGQRKLNPAGDRGQRTEVERHRINRELRILESALLPEHFKIIKEALYPPQLPAIPRP